MERWEHLLVSWMWMKKLVNVFEIDYGIKLFLFYNNITASWFPFLK